MTELKRLDAGAWFGKNFRGARIPSLDEVFEHLGNKLYINVELTNYSSPFDGLVDEVASLVKRHGLEKRILFSSFYPTNLIRAHQLLPETPRGQLTLPRAAGWWQRMWSAVMDVQADHPYISDVTLESVSKSHKRGRLVHTWTVNDPEEMKRLCSLGVDGFFTDDPILARETLSH